MPRLVSRFAATVLLLLVGAGISHAQARLTGADLEGTVRDESGAVLPGAGVVVTNTATNLTRTATTDTQGRFIAPALPPGRYRIAAEMTGFGKASREGVDLALGQSVTIDFTLKVAATQEEITVSAEAPVVDVHDTSVSEIVGQQQIESLPINGRSFISFSVITPGVTVDLTPQQGASATSGLSFAGQRARSNNIMVDGLDNNDAVVGSVRAVFSQEAIREFQVLTNSYSAEFGKASGGVVNIVTKSGTNEIHGNAFFYLRDKSLNSKAHFEKFDEFGTAVNQDKSPFRQYQYGATLGGPIRKDRTFFFLSLERLDAEPSNFVTISTAAATVLNAAGFPVQVGANRYDVTQTQILGKVDHQWSSDSNLVFRFNYSDTDNQNVEPFGGLVAKSRGAEQDRKDYSVSLSQTNILSRKWVNEARVQYAHQDQKINSLDPNCGGACLRNDQGGPTLEVTGFASVGRQRFTPQPRVNDRIQVTNTVSYFGGDHQVKAGFDFNWIDNRDQALPLHFGGRYIFGALPAIPALGLPVPITAIQAVALGVPSAYVQGYGQDATTYKYKDLSIFLQDEWRVGRKLTIKPGIRYQKQFWYEVPYDVSDLGGARLRYSFPQDSNNIAPRVALAFDPKGDGKTSIHLAYGIFFDNHITGIVGITDGIDGSANGVRTLVAAINTSPTTVISAWRAPGHRLTEAQALALLGGSYPSLVISIDPSLETPYAHQVAAGFDRAIGRDLGISANFMYVRGKHQLGTIDYNPVLTSVLGPGRRPNDVGGRAGTSASILQYTDFGETWYRGGTLAISKRYSNHYQFLISYTLSKAEDNSTDFQSAFIPQDNGRGRNPADPTGVPLGFNPDSERGPATWDQRHRLVISGLYQLPADIQLSTIVTLASGRPFTPLAGADLNADGNGGAFPPDRARATPTDIGTSVGRNSENLPSQFSVDLRLGKKFRFGKSGAVEPIFEVFNVFNRTNYSDVNNIFGTGAFPGSPARDSAGRVTYGTFTQALPPRQMQLALKVSF